MLLVTDANVFMSALIARERTLDLFFSEKLQLIAPDFIFTEINEHKEEILKKSGLSKEDFELFISLLATRIEIVLAEEFRSHLEEASKISPDSDDVVYFALALKFDCSIWSNDKRLKEQTTVKILTTEELLEML